MRFRNFKDLSARRSVIVGLGLVVVLGAAWFIAVRPRVEVTTTWGEATEFYERGMRASDRHYYADAERFWRAATEADPEFALAWARLGARALAIGNQDDAHRFQARAEHHAHRCGDRDRMIIGVLGARLRSDDAALAELTGQLMARCPDDPEALLNKALLAMRNREYQEALHPLRRILDLNPQHGEAYNQMGYLLARLRTWDGALEAFQKYAFLYPEEANPHDSLGELYTRLGRYPDALAEFERALAIKPGFYWSRLQMGTALGDLGRYEEGIAQTRQAARDVGANHDREYLCRHAEASLELDRGLPGTALERVQELTSRFGRRPGLHHLAGRIYAALGDVGSAEAELRILRALTEEQLRDRGENPRDVDEDFSVLELTGLIAAADGRWSEALDALSRASAQDSWDWNSIRRARTAYVATLVHAGRPAEAAQAARRTLEENPRHYPTHYWVARAFEDAGMASEAVVHYRLVAEILSEADPGHELRTEAVEKSGDLARVGAGVLPLQRPRDDPERNTP